MKHVFLLPPHVALFVDSPRFRTADLSSINVFTTGGLYISEQLRRTIDEKLTNGSFIVALGMTEVGGIIAETRPGDVLSASVGKPAINTKVKILIDDGTIGGTYEIGEILVKKSARFLGYVNHAQPVSITDDDGWIHTGDMGFIDAHHDIHIVGQRTFIIKNFYNQIFPKEIESIVEELPGVLRCCVVGTPDATTVGSEFEVPSVLVVKAPDCELTEDTIITATNSLPPFKRLRDVFFVESLPLAASGKIQRRIVKEMAEEIKIQRLSRPELSD